MRRSPLLMLAMLAACAPDPAELAREAEAIRGDCTREGLAASNESCVQAAERGVEKLREAMAVSIGAVRALDRALDRMAPAPFDTAGLGRAVSDRALLEQSLRRADSLRGGRLLGPSGSSPLPSTPAPLAAPTPDRALVRERGPDRLPDARPARRPAWRDRGPEADLREETGEGWPVPRERRWRLRPEAAEETMEEAPDTGAWREGRRPTRPVRRPPPERGDAALPPVERRPRPPRPDGPDH